MPIFPTVPTSLLSVAFISTLRRYKLRNLLRDLTASKSNNKLAGNTDYQQVNYDGALVWIKHGKDHQWLGADIKVPSDPNSNQDIVVNE